MSRILTRRLYSWAKENNKIDGCQAGFRRGYSTIDDIFTLQSMVQKYLIRLGGRFYCIYVDFHKAFDKINHNALLNSLNQKGLGGKFHHLLLCYGNQNSCVKTEKGLKDLFPCNTGTKQGDVSSPIIFSLFINDLFTMLRDTCSIFITKNIQDILCLMFADDVASCAETATKLQQISVIQNFCSITGMELNLKKTKIIVFRNGGYLRSYENWKYKGNLIRTTSLYKYMVLLFSPMLSWTSAKIKLASQAQKALNSIINYQRKYGYLLHTVTFKIFDATVKPILCYVSQIWGTEHYDVIESVHAEFCRKFIGVNDSVNNNVALAECGRLPLSVFYQKNCIKYWCKLIQMHEWRYPKQCYLMLKSLDEIERVT